MTLSGCGAARAPAVASVQGSPISRDVLAHWIAIKRAEPESASRPAATLSPTELKQKALAFLIGAKWIEKEAAAEGISVSSAEVDQTYQELLGSLAGPGFASSMARGGMSSADEKLQLRSEKLAGKLRDRSMAGSPTGRQQRFSAFLAAFRLRWKQRTTCQPGYVIAECRNGPPLSASPTK